MDFKDALIGGMFGAELLGLTENNMNLLLNAPLIFSLTVRFDPDANVLEDTVKESFLDEKLVSEIKLVSSDQIVFQYKNGKNRFQTITFEKCVYKLYKKDAFLTIMMRNDKGLTITENIVLLRHFIKKLQDKKIKYEIW